MKKFLLCTLLFISGYIQAQQVPAGKIFSKIADISYDRIPTEIRMDNSGVYGISSFDIQGNNVWLHSFDRAESYLISGSQVKNVIRHKEASVDFAMHENTPVLSADSRLRKIYAAGKEDIYTDNGGELHGSRNDDDHISIQIISRSQLDINYDIPGFKKHFSLNFRSDLAYGDLIGIDAKGNSFLLIERYLTEVPLKVLREVYTLSKDGKILSVLEIPSIKYVYLVRDFQIDADGNLYHLLSLRDGFSVIRWSGLTTSHSEVIRYPKEYNYELHYNTLLPKADASVQADNENTSRPAEIQASSRLSALKIAEGFVTYRYTCRNVNLAPENVKAPDGDFVRTPEWLITGMNAKIPYKWGGFNTLAEFSAGLLNGRYAGDINTDGVSSYAVGLDCSGFVSRCWQLSYHSSTSDMPRISTQYTTWDSIRSGDAVHKVGHVRLFIEKTPNGSLRIAEAAGRDHAVSYWTYTPSDLTAYTPRCYKGMAAEYSLRQPILQSVLQQSDGTVRITWTCDTAGVKGYRLYMSPDGSKWTAVQTENTLKDMYAVLTPQNTTEYYRVSSVLNTSIESNWSGVLGTGKYTGAKKILIVDGFDRETGGWRMKGNTFIMRYGKALNLLKENFESIKSRSIALHSVSLSNYDAIYWMTGDESTADETLSSADQAMLKEYLDNGGRLFVSGSEIAWDVYHRGNADDRYFFNNYLKAIFLSDNASSRSVTGSDSAAFAGSSFYFSQTYATDYPDVITPNAGSILCMSYSNNLGAGVQYAGSYANPDKKAHLIYLAFPLESTANDTAFNSVIAKSDDFFFGQPTGIISSNALPAEYSLSQNYPNPFNPQTSIRFSLASSGHVTIRIFDMLGRQAATLLDEERAAGSYTITADMSGFSSGIYFYTISSGKFVQSRKMTLLK